MPTCPHCGGEQPDDDLLRLHVERYCRAASRPEPEYVAAAEPIEATSAGDHDGIWHPSRDQNFYLPDWIGRSLERLARMSENAPVNVLLRGPQGSGKTSCAKQVAAAFRRPFASIEFGRLQEPRDIFGERLYSPERGTYYVKSLLWRAIETEGCVILLDEINRAENPKVVNPLLSLLDDRREAWVDEIEARLIVAPGVIFAATINEGYDFSGIDTLDAALRDRFHQVLLRYPTPPTAVKIIVSKVGVSHADAKRLIEATSVDGVAPLRSLIKAAQHLKLGASLGEAVRCGFAEAEPERLEALLQRVQAHDNAASASFDASERVWP